MGGNHTKHQHNHMWMIAIICDESGVYLYLYKDHVLFVSQYLEKQNRRQKSKKIRNKNKNEQKKSKKIRKNVFFKI